MRSAATTGKRLGDSGKAHSKSTAEKRRHGTGYHIYRREGEDIVRLTAAPVQAPPLLTKPSRRTSSMVTRYRQ